MIGSIRNPWIRRPLLVLGAPFLVVIFGVLGALMFLFDDFGPEWRRAWRGPT